MNTTTLIRVEEGKYTDQYGYEHDAYRVVERVEVERTKETSDYLYYGHICKDPIYKCGERKFVCAIPNDFGCLASWREEIGNNRTYGWYEERGKNQDIWGKPVIPLTDR